jgi:hypothetical protein
MRRCQIKPFILILLIFISFNTTYSEEINGILLEKKELDNNGDGKNEIEIERTYRNNKLIMIATRES